jgi:hypothetical protein
MRQRKRARARMRAYLLLRLVRVVLQLGRRGAQKDERAIVSHLLSPEGRAVSRVRKSAPPNADLADALYNLHRASDCARSAVPKAAARQELVELGLVVLRRRQGVVHHLPLELPGFSARLAAVALVGMVVVVA